jgi:putative ABC transport system substrate-binding protein
LVERRVDVIVTPGPSAIDAAKSVTGTVPIVAIDFESDPVAARYAASFAKPGGNITGVFLDHAELSGKWLDLLKEAVPKLGRVAVLWDTSTPTHQLNAIKVAAKVLALKIDTLEVRRLNDFEGAFGAAAKMRAQGVVILSSPLLSRHGPELAAAAIAKRLPTISLFREHATGGCLMSYGPSLADGYRRLGSLAGRILKGAKPADLPIEQPTKFELVINLKTAKALGLTIPPSLLARADQVIE